MSKFQEADSFLRVGFALSKWPHFDSVYLLSGPFALLLIVCNCCIIQSINGRAGMNSLFSLVSS